MSKRQKRYNKIKFPLPRCDEELELLTKWYFGKPLHATFRTDKCGDKKLLLSGYYEVQEKFDSYDIFRNSYRETGVSNYDMHSVIWDRVFGDVCTGGVGGVSYGSFVVTKKEYRHAQRLLKWQKLKRNGVRSIPRSAFMRLASRLKEGEERTK